MAGVDTPDSCYALTNGNRPDQLPAQRVSELPFPDVFTWAYAAFLQHAIGTRPS